MRGVDVVIETVGAAVWYSAMKSLVRGGRHVPYGARSVEQRPTDLLDTQAGLNRVASPRAGAAMAFPDVSSTTLPTMSAVIADSVQPRCPCPVL